jgi:predicted ArsR family transcriptional regulator
MKYIMTTKRVLEDIRKADWSQRIEMLTLKNQNWTTTAIGEKLGLSKQAVSRALKYMGSLSVEEAEKLSRL